MVKYLSTRHQGLGWVPSTEAAAGPLVKVSEWREAEDETTHQACKQVYELLGPILRFTKD